MVSGSGVPAAPQLDEQQDRLCDAALALIARWGLAKTSLRDVAKEAGCSRATLYRAFPGGRDALFGALARRELVIAAEAIDIALRDGDDLADALTRAMVVGARLLGDHDAAVTILEHEPEVVLPYLGFGRIDRLIDAATGAFGPAVARHIPPERVGWAIEWGVRTFISYTSTPEPGVDLTDVDTTRTLVDRYIAPAFAGSRRPDHPVPA